MRTRPLRVLCDLILFHDRTYQPVMLVGLLQLGDTVYLMSSDSGCQSLLGMLTRLESLESQFFLDPGKGIYCFRRIETSDRPTIGLL